MKNWPEALRDGAMAGSVASVVSTAALGMLSKRETGSPFAATNAISHWAWGDAAFSQRRLDWPHTGLGYVIHHASSILWSVLYEKLFGDRAAQGRTAQALAGGLAVAGLACFVDYKMTPRRLEPGIEQHLSRRGMGLFYAAFGVGLALTGIALARRQYQ